MNFGELFKRAIKYIVEGIVVALAAYVIPKQNIHIMDKEYLLSDNFNNFVKTICAE